MTCRLVNKLMQAIIQHYCNFDSYQRLWCRKRVLNSECGSKPHVCGGGIGKMLNLHIHKANKRVKTKLKITAKLNIGW